MPVRRQPDQQRTVRHLLERLSSEYRVLDGFRISGPVLDHLVVGPGGVFAITVKHADGHVKLRRDSVWLGSTDLLGDCELARRTAGEIGHSVHHAVTPMVCLVGPKLPASLLLLRHVVICGPEAIVDHIEGAPSCLSASAIESIVARASEVGQRPLPPPTGKALPVRKRATKPATGRAQASGGRGSATRGAPRSIAGRVLTTAAGTFVCVLGAEAVSPAASFLEFKSDAPVAILAEQSTVDSMTADAPQAVDGTIVLTPGETAPAVPEGTPALLPKLDFTCPQIGGGWSASAVATEFQADPVGYHLWYQLAGGEWQYWGQFKSGIATPPVLEGLDAEAELNVRMDRVLHPNAEGAPTMLTFTAPDQPC